MHVLFLTTWYPTKTNPHKGIFILKHAQAISKAGYKIIFLALSINNGNDFYKKNIHVTTDAFGIETHHIEIESYFYKWIYINPLFLFYIINTYYKTKIISACEIKIIHSNVINPAGIIGYWLSKKHNTFHIITEHWSMLDNYIKKNLFSTYAKKAYNNASYITVVSSYLKSIVEKYVDNKNTIRIVANAIDEKLFYYAPKINSKEIVFMAVANWSLPKKPLLFVNALKEVQQKINKPIVLNLVGNGPLLDEIKNKTYNFKINFLGSMDHIAIGKLLRESSFFVHASETETFSAVVAEALLTGTPVIASKVGALPELINNTNGILCENTIAGWTEAINKAITIDYNYELISKESSKKYGSAGVGQQFSRLYDELLNLQ